MNLPTFRDYFGSKHGPETMFVQINVNTYFSLNLSLFILVLDHCFADSTTTLLVSIPGERTSEHRCMDPPMVANVGVFQVTDAPMYG